LGERFLFIRRRRRRSGLLLHA